HRLVLRSTSGANREALPMLRKTRAVHLRILWHCRPSGTGLRVASPIAPRPRASSTAKQMHVREEGEGQGWRWILSAFVRELLEEQERDVLWEGIRGRSAASTRIS